MQRRSSDEMEIFKTYTQRDSLSIGQWNNFENWSTFAEVMTKIKCASFFLNMAYYCLHLCVWWIWLTQVNIC